MPKNSSNDIQWDDIDKVRFYGIGTGMYTLITMALHPINVLKTRQQVLSDSTNVKQLNTSFAQRIRGMYRGLGIVLVMAVPARGIYIGSLEHSKDYLQKHLQKSNFSVDQQPIIASISGSIAGGFASGVAQSMIVPMDVVSQRQMVMIEPTHSHRSSALYVINDILRKDGIRGFYRGFGMSLFSSLPIGTLWWGSYSGMQHCVQNKLHQKGFETQDISVRGFIQVASGVTAAVVAATTTQPLDVVKTRVQVASISPVVPSPNMSPIQLQQKVTYAYIARELYSNAGVKGFFKGTFPRIASMSLWGTVLSSAYEILRHVSRKDYDFGLEFSIGMKKI